MTNYATIKKTLPPKVNRASDIATSINRAKIALRKGRKAWVAYLRENRDKHVADKSHMNDIAG